MRRGVGGVEGIDRLRSQRTPPKSLDWRCGKACWRGADRASSWPGRGEWIGGGAGALPRLSLMVTSACEAAWPASSLGTGREFQHDRRRRDRECERREQSARAKQSWSY